MFAKEVIAELYEDMIEYVEYLVGWPDGQGQSRGGGKGKGKGKGNEEFVIGVGERR